MIFSKFGLVDRLKFKVKHILFHQLGFVRRKIVTQQFFDREYSLIANSVYTKAEHDSAWCFQLARHAEIVFDVGVNTGQNALIMLHNDSVKRMVLVEPNPEALSIAAENLMRNNLMNKINCYCAFASNKLDEQMKFWSFHGDASGSMHAHRAATAKVNNQFSYVPTVTLDHIAENYQMTPDLIKMDIEGAELLALDGCVNIAAQQKTLFIVEMHKIESLSKKEIVQKMMDWGKKNQYRLWYLKNKQEITSPEVTEGRQRYHILLTPKDQDFPEYLKNIEEHQPIESLL